MNTYFRFFGIWALVLLFTLLLDSDPQIIPIFLGCFGSMFLALGLEGR